MRFPLFSHLLLAALSVGLLPVPAVAQAPLNLGFEQGYAFNGVARPAGWSVSAPHYELQLDSVIAREGRSSLVSRYAGMGPRSEGGFAAASLDYPTEEALGRAVRVTGWIRTEGVEEGYAGLWLRVDGPDGPMLIDNMYDEGPSGTTEWRRYSIELPVDSSATRIVFGVLHPGTGTAWFDSLSVEVFGPDRARRVPPAPEYEPPPRPSEDLTRLLTDEELSRPPDPRAPAENEEWRGWVRESAHPVRSLGASDFSDLAFLEPLLAGRRIVQLGESGHGVREFNMAKVRLIRYLHEALGYDVIAFESSLFECEFAGRQAAELGSLELMRGCIFGVWRTEELVPLFDYVRETQATARPLRLTGFDVQTSSTNASERAGFLAELVGRVDSEYGSRVYLMDGRVQNDIRRMRGRNAAADRIREYVDFYESLAEWIRLNEADLVQAMPEFPTAPIIARQTALSMAAFVALLGVESSSARFEMRDVGMADNIDFLADELYPEEKIIVWAHNAHIAHRGYHSDPERRRPAAGARTMGSFVAERRGHELYSVGLFMYRGSAAMNDRRIYQVGPAIAGSLESIVHGSPWKYSFVDLSRPERSAGTEWMYEPIMAKEWGLNPYRLVPRNDYDGILFIDTTWPPEYLPR